MSVNRKFLIGAAILAICALGVPAAIAQPVPGGTLDPGTIPKYVTPLVIPPVLYDDQGGAVPLDGEVALRQINQQVLPAGFPATPLWAYGNPADPATFNNPGFTVEVTKDTMTTVKWINGLVDATGNYLQHVLKDNYDVPVIDQLLLWAAPNQDCLNGVARPDCRGASDQPYTGPVPMVTQVHGAHTNAVSAGYPEAWWLPAAYDIPSGYATEGTFYDNTPGTGSAVYQYTNNQPTSTLWYRDNTVGIARLNQYAAGAGFWLIRDTNDGETGLLQGVLPGPAPKLGDDPNGDPAVRAAIRETPIIIQPKSFNADGSLFYPADRAFFEGLGNGQTFAYNTGLNIPFLPQATSDIAPVWNPETFFNTMVVNGITWPVLEVAPERYRFRILNAADSRFLNLSLHQLNENGDKLRELAFYQIGADQSLLPNVVRIETGFATTLPGNGSDVNPNFPDCLLPNGKGKKNCQVPVPGTFSDQALLIAPSERADVIVDFSGFEDGDVIRIFNTAPDAPFGGFPDVPADPETTGQVMQFIVNSALSNPDGDPSSKPSKLVLDNNPGGVPPLEPSDFTQNLALLEEESALLCVTVDAVTGAIDLDPNSLPPNCDYESASSFPFAPKATVLGINGSIGGQVQLWNDPIAQNPAEDDTETWELWNWTADAEAIHLDQVKFEVVNRENIVLGNSGVVRQSEPWETGWKDTVIAYPGEITRIKAKFDILGLFTWGSRILSHGDNEMMVPYCVGEAGVDCPAELFPLSP